MGLPNPFRVVIFEAQGRKFLVKNNRPFLRNHRAGLGSRTSLEKCADVVKCENRLGNQHKAEHGVANDDHALNATDDKRTAAREHTLPLHEPNDH